MFDNNSPVRRENPPFTGEVDTTQIGGIYDIQNMKGDPHCGYKIPSPTPLPPVFPAMTGAEQIRDLGLKVNELCSTIEGYNHKVEDAYNAIINSTICNDAYYNDMWSETGYIPESGSNYKVVHVPFLDRSKQPVYFELGLAFDNTTNAGLKEECFAASQRFLADKLIPAQNKADSFTGTVVWKGAPIYTQSGDSYTFAVTQSGFFKGYKNAVAETLKADKIRNSCGARGILVYNKERATDSFPEDASTMKARVAVGQNYDTKERFIIVVDGGESVGCTSEQLANLFIKYGCMVAIELASGTSVYGMDKGAMMFAPAVASEDDTPSVPVSNAFWYITKRRHYHNEYVRDVALLTQQMGEEIWRRVILNEQTDYVKSRIVELAKEIDDERDERKSEIERVEGVCNRIETESKERDNALTELIAQRVRESEERDAQLQVNIDNEAKTREENDNTLQSNIDKEAQTRETNDNTLQSNLDAEANTRHLEDVQKVAHVDDGDKRTYSLYRYDDTKIGENIEVYEYNKLIAQFVTMAQIAENLKTETSERKKADDNLQSQITQEISDRTNAVTTLTSGLTEETNQRKAADTQLTNTLNNEVTTREANVKELNERLDDYSSTTDGVIKELSDDLKQEITDRGTADNTIKDLLTTEQTARIDADDAIKALITAEAIARENKDTELADSIKALTTDYNTFKTDTTADLAAKKTQLDALVVDVTNIKSVIDTHTTQMSSINATITALQTTISSMEVSLENMKQSIANLQSAFDTFKATTESDIAAIEADIANISETISQLGSTYVLRTGDTLTDAEYTLSSSSKATDVTVIRAGGITTKDSLGSTEISSGIYCIDKTGYPIASYQRSDITISSSANSHTVYKDGLIYNCNKTTNDIRSINLSKNFLVLYHGNDVGPESNISDDTIYPVYTKTPTKDLHAATKKYVDDKISALETDADSKYAILDKVNIFTSNNKFKSNFIEVISPKNDNNYINIAPENGALNFRLDTRSASLILMGSSISNVSRLLLNGNVYLDLVKDYDVPTAATTRGYVDTQFTTKLSTSDEMTDTELNTILELFS